MDRNFALDDLALVIRVFSRERVSLRFSRNLAMRDLIHSDFFFVPQTPISQSSAYLTYLILVTWLWIIDFKSLRSLTSLIYLIFRSLVGLLLDNCLQFLFEPIDFH